MLLFFRFVNTRLPGQQHVSKEIETAEANLAAEIHGVCHKASKIFHCTVEQSING